MTNVTIVVATATLAVTLAIFSGPDDVLFEGGCFFLVCYFMPFEIMAIFKTKTKAVKSCTHPGSVLAFRSIETPHVSRMKNIA